MPGANTKLEILSEEVFRRKAAGKTNREIAQSDGLTHKQIKKLITRQNSNDMTASLVTGTIRDAMQKELAADGLTLHSDQGSQYTSQASQEYHFRPSMSSPGCPYDSTSMENFFGTLKSKCLYRRHFSCRFELEQAVDE